MKHILLVILLLIASCQTPISRNPAEAPGYDEIYDEAGNIREQYREFMRVYMALSDKDKALFNKLSLQDLSQDNPIHALPRILTEEDNELLQKGVDQRSRALVEFLKDHLSGERNYIKDGIIPEAVIKRILNRHQEQTWIGNLELENLNFLYGPDVIRLADGSFVALEDNTAMVGGFGDTVAARKSLYDHIPAYADLVDSPDPEKFFEQMAKELNDAAKKMGGIAVILTHPRKMHADAEQERIKKIFQKYNIETVVYTGSPVKKMVIEDDGAYLVITKNGKKQKQKIGHVLSYLDSEDIDYTDEMTKGKSLMFNAERYLKHDWVTDVQKNKIRKLINTNPVDLKKLEQVLYYEVGELGNLDYKNGVPGLLKLMRDKKLTMTNPPGFDFVNDKEFYIYVDKLIEYYLKDEPIIKNLPTKSFAKIGKDGVEVLDLVALEKVKKNQKKYVIKQVSGRGGSEVYLGNKLSEQEFKKTLDLVKKAPHEYIYQQRVNLSTFGDLLGHYRPLSFVTALKTIISPVPWARVNFLNGDGKANISGTGFEAVVLIWKKAVGKLKKTRRSCMESIEVFVR